MLELAQLGRLGRQLVMLAQEDRQGKAGGQDHGGQYGPEQHGDTVPAGLDGRPLRRRADLGVGAGRRGRTGARRRAARRLASRVGLVTGNPAVRKRDHAIGHLRDRTFLYRIVDAIGRWSMIDIFMISILVALVRFGKFSSVQAELGAPCFAAVVVLTMFAVNAFDPRLMWDRAAEHHARLVSQPAGQA